jgi:hypothetical protein
LSNPIRIRKNLYDIKPSYLTPTYPKLKELSEIGDIILLMSAPSFLVGRSNPSPILAAKPSNLEESPNAPGPSPLATWTKRQLLTLFVLAEPLLAQVSKGLAGPARAMAAEAASSADVEQFAKMDKRRMLHVVYRVGNLEATKK